MKCRQRWCHKEEFLELRYLAEQEILKPSARPRRQSHLLINVIGIRGTIHISSIADCRNACFILYNILCYATSERNIVDLRGNWGERCKSAGKAEAEP